MASLQDRQEGIIVKLFDLVHEADSYQPPELSVGDRILKGKFKNSPAEIKGFTKDKHNQPVLKTNRGEVQLFKPRVAKLMTQDVAEDREYIPSGKTRITRHGIDLVVSIDGVTVDIRAMSGDSQMAYVVFDRDGDTLVADDLAVEEQYKGQGIAKIMYDYVKELGFRVKRSSDQLVAGKKFWDKNKGAENNIWEQGVAEGLNEFTPDNGGEITERINQKSIQAGFKDHQKVMGGKFDFKIFLEIFLISLSIFAFKSSNVFGKGLYAIDFR